MSELLPIPEPVTTADVGDSPVARKRPKPGERRMQILQTLAEMLEQPGAERITTAALAARLSVSEAALYRHFASKAQMFEGLIEFIEQTVFTRVTQIVGRDPADAAQPAEGGAHQIARFWSSRQTGALNQSECGRHPGGDHSDGSSVTDRADVLAGSPENRSRARRRPLHRRARR